MRSADLLIDAYGRITEVLHRGLDGATPEILAYRPEPGSNSIAWLAWHLTRVQDDHLAELEGEAQRWIADGYLERFALPFDERATGFGHQPRDVEQLGTVPLELLAGYHDAVSAHTRAWLAGLDDAALDRIVDTSYSPAVTLGVRLVSVISDNLQHAGQAAYLRGLVERGSLN